MTDSKSDLPLIQREFPDYPVAAIPALPEGFDDVSWHNDACPSYANDEFLIYLDYADKEMRESGNEGTRFSVYPVTADGCMIDSPVIETDDWQQVLKAVAPRKVEKTAERLDKDGICVGYAGTTFDRDGKPLTVFIPRRDEDIAADRAARK